MRKAIAILFLFMILGGAAALRAEDKSGDLGLGVVLGDLNGPTMKYFMGPNTALDLGLGFSNDFEAYGDVVWHAWDMFPRPEKGRFAGTLAVGPRFEDREHADDKFGVRTMAGIGYWMDPYPLEFFFEFGPWFIFTPDTDTEFDAGIGLRYYFTPGRGGSSSSSKTQRR